MTQARGEDLERIIAALDTAEEVLTEFTSGDIDTHRKRDGQVVTDADIAVDTALRDLLPVAGEGWLSEESADDLTRLECSRVWVVDPIDGTNEYIRGIPEWCVSIGLLADGEPVAGGIVNPASEERFVGGLGHGVTYDGPQPVNDTGRLKVAASRSEVRRGEWKRYADADMDIVVSGSVAYKMALVAACIVDATWTLKPKHEWDVAGGAALVRAADGWVALPDGREPEWNQRVPSVPGFVATAKAAADGVWSILR